MLIVKLKPKKEMPVFKKHPWIFSGAIENVNGSPDEEPVCRVIDSKGHFICQGFYNPLSQIAVRVLSYGKESINSAFFTTRIKQSLNLRKSIIHSDTTCFRLINAEGDLIPGLVVDIYVSVIIVQFLCPGIEKFKEEIVDILHALYPDSFIHERSDMRARNAEGLRPNSGPLYGELPQGDLTIHENGIPFVIDVLTGDRTGFYLDHRVNRQRFQNMAKDKDVLDLFSYTGAFSVYAIKGGAKSVLSVESSSPAQALLQKTMAVNHADPFLWKHIKDDAFRFLSDHRSSYDLIICDPPSFFKDESEEYIKLNSLAIARLKSGGILFTTALTGPQFSEPDFLKVISKAGNNLSRNTKILEPLYQAPDFPVLPSHPQGTHLLGYIVYVE